MAAKPGMLKAILAYEPGMFAFPEGERPAEIPGKAKMVDELMQLPMVPMDDFPKLTKVKT